MSLKQRKLDFLSKAKFNDASGGTLNFREEYVGVLYLRNAEYFNAGDGLTSTRLELYENEDKDGSIEAIYMGKLPASLTKVPSLRVEGQLREYNGVCQLMIVTLPQVGHLGPYKKEYPVRKWVDDLCQHIEKIKNPLLRDMVEMLTVNSAQFLKVPASVDDHHAHKCGLLEHTKEVVEIALSSSVPIFTSIDYDILIAGAALHDIGKTRMYGIEKEIAKEYKYFRLYEHTILGCDLVTEEAKKRKIQQEIIDMINHIILSHNTVLSESDPVKPMTLEAFLVRQANTLSALHDTVYSESLDKVTVLNRELLKSTNDMFLTAKGRERIVNGEFVELDWH